jgi:hypothetical protein
LYTVEYSKCVAGEVTVSVQVDVEYFVTGRVVVDTSQETAHVDEDP